MPDHWHGLVELGATENLSRAVGRAKACAAREWKQADAGKLWSPGFHDRAVRSHENLRDAARYIVANPVRAGLVNRAGDYPFWDASGSEADVQLLWERPWPRCGAAELLKGIAAHGRSHSQVTAATRAGRYGGVDITISASE